MREYFPPQTSTFLCQSGRTHMNDQSQNGAEQERFFLAFRTARKAATSSSIIFFAQMLLGERQFALSKRPTSHPCRGPAHPEFPLEGSAPSFFGCLDWWSCRTLRRPCCAQPSPRHHSCSCAGILGGRRRGSGSYQRILSSSC